jgi:hypothetical protein
VTGPPGSARACPVCGRHTLALERPPEIQVVGAQPYTELYRMGDLPMPVGVRCRACEAWWPTVEALEAGDPPSTDDAEPIAGLEIIDDVPAPPGAATGAGSRASVGSIVVLVGAFAVGAALLAAGLLQLAFIVVGCGVLVARSLRRRPGRAA